MANKYGNNSNNTLYGDGSDQSIFGYGGDDYLYGYGGADELFGGDGRDHLYGGSGDDNLDGGSGDDWLDGGSGSDNLHGGDGADELQGGSENDYLYGNAGNDLVYGEDGDDILSGGTGDDYVSGGIGNDRVMAKTGDGTDRYAGGEFVRLAPTFQLVEGQDFGIDTIDYSFADHAVEVNLLVEKTWRKANVPGEAAVELEDLIFGFENVEGSAFHDILRGDEEHNDLSGGDGNDTYMVMPATIRFTGGIMMTRCTAKRATIR